VELQRYGLHKRLFERLGVSGDALYLFIAASLAILVSGFAAHLLHEPFLFPSLGPTVFLFFEQPLESGSSPRSAILGHFTALAVGYLSVMVFGLLDDPSILEVGVSAARIGATTLSVGLTDALILLAHGSHPPAGATALIVSLGLLATPQALVVMALSVMLLTATGWTINRTFGVPVPLWSPPVETPRA